MYCIYVPQTFVKLYDLYELVHFFKAEPTIKVYRPVYARFVRFYLRGHGRVNMYICMYYVSRLD